MHRGIVNILNRDLKSCGTGFFVSLDGYLLTCAHVLSHSYATSPIFIRCSGEGEIEEAELVACKEDDDLALLHVGKHQRPFVPFCVQTDTGLNAECYGFPNGCDQQMVAHVTIDGVLNDGNTLQLGNANSITLGYSGSPVIHDKCAIGIVHSITKSDEQGRLVNIAMAISAKRIVELFGRYVAKKECCIGYGEQVDKCRNYAVNLGAGVLCEKCFSAEFYDSIRSLLEAQNYKLHDCGTFVVGELIYGVSTYYDAFFP